MKQGDETQSLKQKELELIKSTYEQNWFHLRHVENERLWFTNCYVVMVGVLLVFSLREGTPHLMRVGVLFFLVFMSILGIIFSLRVREVVYQHHLRTKMIAEEYNLQKYTYIGRTIEEYKQAGFKGLLRKTFYTLSMVFILFYLVSFSSLACLLIYEVTIGI